MLIANCRLKSLFVLLLMCVLLTACGNSKPLLQQQAQVQIPPPPAELMIPLPEPSVNVQALLSKWTGIVRARLALQRLCRDTPEKCV